jgi:hypothetical protein
MPFVHRSSFDPESVKGELQTMTTSNQNPPESSEERRFIQRAMADIDKAAKVQKIKQVVVIGLLFGALVWLAIRQPGPGLKTLS